MKKEKERKRRTDMDSLGQTVFIFVWHGWHLAFCPLPLPLILWDRFGGWREVEVEEGAWKESEAHPHPYIHSIYIYIYTSPLGL